MVIDRILPKCRSVIPRRHYEQTGKKPQNWETFVAPTRSRTCGWIAPITGYQEIKSLPQIGRKLKEALCKNKKMQTISTSLAEKREMQIKP